MAKTHKKTGSGYLEEHTADEPTETQPGGESRHDLAMPAHGFHPSGTISLWRDQAASMSRQVPAAAVATCVCSVLIAFLFWHDTDHTKLVLWATGLWATSLILLIMWWHDRATPAADDAKKRTLRVACVLAVVSGCLWGAGLALLLDHANELQQFVLLTIAGVLAAGAAAFIPQTPVACIGFAVPCAAPIGVRLLFTGDSVSLVKGGMFLLLLGALLVTARRSYRHFVDRAYSRHANREMADYFSAAHDRLTDALGSISEGFIYYGPDRRIVFCNQRFKEFWPGLADLLEPGRTYDDLVAAAAELVVIPDGDVTGWANARTRYREQRQGHFEVQLKMGRWLRINDRRTSDGGIVSIHTDITTRRREEAELRGRNDVLQMLATGEPLKAILTELVLTTESASPEMICSVLTLSEDGKTLQVAASPSLPSFFNDSIEGLEIGPGVGSCGNTAYTGERTIVEDIQQHPYWADVRELAGKAGVQACWSEPIRSSAGDILGTLAVYSRHTRTPPAAEIETIQAAAHLAGIAIEGRHTEEALKQSEKRLRAIAEATPLPVVITRQQDGTVLYCNRQVEALLGVPPEAVVGHSMSQFYADPSQRARLIRKIEEKGFVRDFEIEMVCKDGRKVATLHSVQSTTLDGQPALLGGFMDITDRKRWEKELQDAKDQAVLANRTKSEFLANMSHELRTPLNAILGFSEVIENEILGPIGPKKYTEYAADIHASGSHLLAIINDILDLAKIESGQASLDEESMNIGDAVASCVRLIHDRASDAGVTVRTEIADNLPGLAADERKIKQILINLLSNAVKFTPAAGEVTISAQVDTDGAMDIVVRDSGIGMEPSEIPRALEPFAQVDGSLSRKHEGTGLGLPLAKMLCELHEGQLLVDSVKNRGTTVSLRFPKHRVGA